MIRDHCHDKAPVVEEERFHREHVALVLPKPVKPLHMPSLMKGKMQLDTEVENDDSRVIILILNVLCCLSANDTCRV